MKNQIFFGECLELMTLIEDQSIEMIFADLPYGTTRNKWDEIIPFKPLWKQYERIIKPNGAIVLMGSGLFTARLMLSNPTLYRYSLVWEKTTPTGHLNANKMPLRSHEDILVFYRRPPTYNPQKSAGHKRKVSLARHKVTSRATTNYGAFGLHDYDSTERFPKSVLKFATDKQKSSIHPTQKPVKLLEYLIKTYSNEGETVLDSCSGSGSTAVACVNTGRNYICIESDQTFYNDSLERVGKIIHLKLG